MSKTKRSRGRQVEKKEKMMNPNRDVHTNIIKKMTSKNKEAHEYNKKNDKHGKKLFKIVYFMMFKREIMFFVILQKETMFIEIKGRWSNAKTYNKTKFATKFSSSKLVNK
jgi:hypothetical protein